MFDLRAEAFEFWESTWKKKFCMELRDQLMKF